MTVLMVNLVCAWAIMPLIYLTQRPVAP
jgi:hypothetical protein